MEQKQTESSSEPQYHSRRERRAAEGHVRYDSRRERRNAEGYVPLTEDQKGQLEDAHYYLMEQSANVEANMRNKKLFPGYRILSLVDQKGLSTTDLYNKHGLPVDLTEDLETQVYLLGTFESELSKANWPLIADLAQNKRSGDSEKASINSQYTAEQKADPEMYQKIGRFIGRRLAEGRHFWLNTKTTEAKTKAGTSAGYTQPRKHRSETNHTQPTWYKQSQPASGKRVMDSDHNQDEYRRAA